MRFLGIADAEVTRSHADGGVDVTSSTHVAQVKHYTGSVGAPEVQQLVGVAHTTRREPIFFTSGKYTRRTCSGRSGRHAAHGTYDANISSTNTCTTADGLNVIDFGGLTGGTLGLTCTWYTGSGVPVQADVRIDTSDRSWVTTTTGCSGASYDLRSVMTHELGHVLGLDHAAENGGSDLTMSPNITNCNASARTLGAGDLTGIYVKHGA